MRTEAFERRLYLGFAAVAVIVGFVVALAVENSRQLRRGIERAGRTQEVLREANRLLTTMVDAETGMRGFLLTGDEDYLAPYERALQTIDGRVARLKELLDETYVNRESVKELEGAIAEQIAFRRGVVATVRSQGAAAARAGTDIDFGKRGMDRIREIVGNLETGEEQALAVRKAAMEATDRRSLGILALFALLIVALMLGGLLLTRHHLAERKRLEDEQNRFFTLSHDLYCVAGTDGFFKVLNPSWEKAMGYSQDELKAKRFVDFVHPEDRAATLAEAAKLARGEPTIYFENRYLARDGSYKWLLWSAASVPAEKLIYAVARDISEHKRTEAQIVELGEEAKRRAAELEAVNQELEAFSYSVSHDLRAPLRHVAGFADMLQRHAGATMDAKGQRFIQTIVDSAKRMGMLIDDLLVFSRMGRAEMRKEIVDLNQMVDSIIAEMQPDLGERKIVWKKETLPAAYGDKAMLRQVLVNLLGNAVKYSRPRAVAEIEISARMNNGDAIYQVRDNGVGFDMAYAHKLFGVFHRLHEASQFEGTGIGLANVRRIVARHGGRVWAEAELDKGAAFHFSLPKEIPHAAS